MKTLALAAAVAMAASSATAGPIISVQSHLVASPAFASGPCPQTITFNGAIKVVGQFPPGTAAQFGVQFLRKDGAIAPINYFNVSGTGGTHPVSTTWQLGGASLPTYDGWEQVKVWPTAGGFPYTYSNKAAFKMVCSVRRQGPAPRPGQP